MELKRALFFRNIVYCLPVSALLTQKHPAAAAVAVAPFHALLRTRCGAWSWAQCCSLQLLPSCVTWSWTQCCSFPQVLTGCLLSTFEKMFLGFGLCFGQCPACSFPRLLRHSFACSFSRLLKQTLNPSADSLGFSKHPDHKKKIALCSSLLESNTLTSALLPQVLLPSSFLEFSSKFLVSTYLIWILGSKLILSNNQSNATLWLLDTCLIIELVPLMIIFITSSLSSKNGRLSFCTEEWAFVVT